MGRVGLVASLRGRSTPALRETGKALVGIVPTSCSVERYFSTEKSIQALTRNRTVHEKVAKVMFLHMNLYLVDEVVISEEDLDFFGSVAAGDGESGGAKESVGKGRRGLDASEND